MENLKSYKISIKGIVQGVGFRPFIWRVCKNMDLKGFVTNTTDGVYMEINSSGDKDILKLIETIHRDKPPQSLIESVEYRQLPFKHYSNFSIERSIEGKEKFQLISPDIATCKSCLEDINDVNNKRRHGYPFTNCTNCGPRFTIIDKMPYDRVNTTMHNFLMCQDCQKEYDNPSNRRFHAQPNACTNCGPRILIMDKSGRVLNKKDAISFAVKKLNEGKIIAVKSLGGFQIACNATSDKAVLLLRKRKMRPFKPFAVMFKDLKEIEKYLQTDSMEKASLLSPAAPIVLLKKKHRNEALDSIQQIKPAKNHGSKNNDLSLSKFISFNNKYEGAILPYTPLHHLIFNKIQIPLIMTSGNISEEPIASNNPEALEKLKGICDFFLVHDRDISSKYDDSVLKITDKKEMLVRRGRGFAPYPLKLNFDTGDKVILAVGAHEKNTFCLIKKNYAILSQHIGDLDSLESNDFFQSTLNNYLNLFNIDKIDIVAYDSHPLYSSSIFALNHFKDSKKIKIQHHKAHAASVVAENNLANHSFIAFTWDGTGFGDDNSIWGSEVFVSTGNSPFKRVAHLRKKQLAGGEVTIKKPYRAALIYLFELFKNNFFNYTGLETGMDFSQILFHFFPFYKNIITEVEINIIRKQLNSGFVNPVTTSMGRFFDAVSSILDITHISSFEGQAAIDLEMAASEKTGDFYDAGFINSIENRDKNKTFIIDDYLLFSFILKDINKGVAKNVISARFHNTLAYAVLNISNILREDLRINTVLLTGGVFQNNLLFNKCFQALKKEGFEVYSNFKVPVNDGGISLGQAYLAAQYLKGKHF